MFSDLFDYISENPFKSLAVVAATLATGGAAAAMAPAIGAAVSAAGLGVAGGTLSGALGGGSLASGGLGMAGGKAVVTTVGAVIGGSTSGSIAKSSSTY